MDICNASRKHSINIGLRATVSFLPEGCSTSASEEGVCAGYVSGPDSGTDERPTNSASSELFTASVGSAG